MEFRETLLAAQRNQQQQSSTSSYYKAKFDPPKKEQKQKDRLSANIQKFLAKKDEEEKQKKLDARKKKEELLAMRDPKALRKIQKTLKVIKSANKSVIEDAVDHNNTAVTRDGPDQPDQDDYGYESQEAAAIYAKMMQKYSKMPDEPKFPVGYNTVKKDLKGTMERVKHALQHEDDPVPHKRRRKGGTGERDDSPPSKYEPERDKKKDEQTKSEKPKFRKPAPPPMDFNQLLKLAEQKKSEPIEVAAKKVVTEQESMRPMTKKQKREYEEELARRQRRQERLDAEKGGKKVAREERSEKERKPEPAMGFGRIPKVGDKNSNNSKNDNPKLLERDRQTSERDRLHREIEKAKQDKEKAQRERDRLEKEDRVLREERLAKERLDKLNAEREKIERDIERLNRDREKLNKTQSRMENGAQPEKSSKHTLDRSKVISKERSGNQDVKKIDLKSQNTYRIDKNSNDRKFTIPSKNNGKYVNGDLSHSKASQGSKDQVQRDSVKDRELLARQALKSNGGRIESRKPDSKAGPSRRPEERPSGKLQPGSSKPKMSNSFDFEKHINSIGAKNVGKPSGARQFPPGDVRRKQNADGRKKAKRRLASDSEYDSEMDDFIDDGDENEDYSSHIKEIFGYDKSKYRDVDDDDVSDMESSFARQQREEYISKKIGIMEDLEDMRMEAMEKKKAKKKGRRISDDD